MPSNFSALQNYLSPLAPNFFPPDRYAPNQWGSKLRRYTNKGDMDGLETAQIAVMGVLPTINTDNDNDNNNNTAAADKVRPHLYELYNRETDYRIADIGNVQGGNTPHDTLHAISAVVEILLRRKIIPIIIGHEHYQTVGQFWGHGMLEKPVSIILFDQKLDFGQKESELSAHSFLYKILHDPRLYHFTLAAYQRYLVNADMIDTLEQLNFECYNLGDVRKNVQEAEPMVRQMQMVSFDLSSLKYVYAPAAADAGPNGLNGEDACSIMRYAGMSDYVSSLGLYGYCYQKDKDQQTARLLAQMIWYFSDGFYNRKYDFPEIDHKHFLQYIVHLKDSDHELRFLKSRKSDRWWMSVPAQGLPNEIAIVPCSYNDYQAACRDEIPERWLKAVLRYQ